MKLSKSQLIAFLIVVLSFSTQAELKDQGLNSIMEIIDKAIVDINETPGGENGVVDPAVAENAIAAIVNLSRTLGTLSYSRLQCGEAGVLAEFTQRVQMMPDKDRDAMRDAFQEGFDRSKADTALLSQDECERLTQSRKRNEDKTDANIAEDQAQKKAAEVEEVVEVVLPPEDPKFRHLRIAELSGQLAYRRKFCRDEKVFNRDYNEYLESIPEEYRDEVKNAYWKGYKHGKRLNKQFTQDQCPQTS